MKIGRLDTEKRIIQSFRDLRRSTERHTYFQVQGWMFADERKEIYGLARNQERNGKAILEVFSNITGHSFPEESIFVSYEDKEHQPRGVKITDKIYIIDILCKIFHTPQTEKDHEPELWFTYTDLNVTEPYQLKLSPDLLENKVNEYETQGLRLKTIEFGLPDQHAEDVMQMWKSKQRKELWLQLKQNDTEIPDYCEFAFLFWTRRQQGSWWFKAIFDLWQEDGDGQGPESIPYLEI